MRSSFATLFVLVALSAQTGCQSMKDCFNKMEAYKKDLFCNHGCFGSAAPAAAPIYAVPIVQQACPQPAPCQQACQPICQPISCEVACDPCSNMGMNMGGCDACSTGMMSGGTIQGGTMISSGQPTLAPGTGTRFIPQPGAIGNN